jgi:hypothetical protein
MLQHKPDLKCPCFHFISIRSSIPKDIIHLQHKIHSITQSLTLITLLSCYRKWNNEKHFPLTVLNILQRTIRHKQMTYFTLSSHSEMFPSRDSYYSIQFSEATTTSRVLHCALQMINFKLLITRVLGHVYLQHKIQCLCGIKIEWTKEVTKTHETV